jgi:hypothetical protein
MVSNGDYGIFSDRSPDPDISFNNVWDNGIANYYGCSAGTGDISADPLFVNGAEGDYHLTASSPCIDAATSDDAPEYDFDGNARCDDPLVPNTGGGTYPYYDIGAYEYTANCP